MTRKDQAGRVKYDVSVSGSGRRGVRSHKGPAIAESRKLADPTICDACGAVYTRRTWRFDHDVAQSALEHEATVSWDVCPACRQLQSGVAYGRIVASGSFTPEERDTIERRIANVAERAQHTEPLRRVLSVDWRIDGFDVFTTSQKLAHRIVKQLAKLYGGETKYSWSDRDGALHATWRR
jgi:NMD protein affecting ribosome stability and mRNA decay